MNSRGLQFRGQWDLSPKPPLTPSPEGLEAIHPGDWLGPVNWMLRIHAMLDAYGMNVLAQVHSLRKASQSLPPATCTKWSCNREESDSSVPQEWPGYCCWWVFSMSAAEVSTAIFCLWLSQSIWWQTDYLPWHLPSFWENKGPEYHLFSQDCKYGKHQLWIRTRVVC